jgi:asparagine synthase (glutamine-hydrolysing)
MARSVDCRLVEYPRNDHLNLEQFRECNLTVRPVLNFSAPDLEARNAKLAQELSASAIFNGELGDNLFGAAPSAGILVDSIRRKGFGGQFLRVATDYAMLTKQSAWRSFALTWRESQDISKNPDFSPLRSLQRRHGVDAAKSLGLASTKAHDLYIELGDRFLHSWMKGARDLAPGSDGLLFGLVVATSPMFHSPFADPNARPQISPLISQPLAEIVLRIPSYLHCNAGQDRAVARAAFADVLPTDVLLRGTGKGGPDLWAKDVIENNVPFLQEYLLGGALVQRGLIDPIKLENALSSHMVKSTAMISDIFAKLYIEAWTRNFRRM